uniref:Cocaine- and amphetamine-regulated transcript protein n=1 Tax=Denticeps clupeoides TaxID=299321 RepID=A0AAY4EVE8_9TELE
KDKNKLCICCIFCAVLPSIYSYCGATCLYNSTYIAICVYYLQIEALQEVLERLKNTEKPPAEKKLGWVPSCDAGEPCAVRKGARIGKLCACPRGTSCSFSVMKCS